jgi:hypothetical protein
MGLDQYLFAVPKGTEGEGFPEQGQVIVQWRKANQIHRWMEEHVVPGGGHLENVVRYRVHPEQLMELYTAVCAVLDDPAQATRLLPTQQGFFYGPTEYDDWYLQELAETKKQLEAFHLDPRATGTDLYYLGWW